MFKICYLLPINYTFRIVYCVALIYAHKHVCDVFCCFLGQPRLVTAPQVLQGATLPAPAAAQPSLGVLGSPIISRLPNGQVVVQD